MEFPIKYWVFRLKLSHQSIDTGVYIDDSHVHGGDGFSSFWNPIMAYKLMDNNG